MMETALSITGPVRGDSNSLVYDNVWALAEDADKNIWIGTLGEDCNA